MHRGIFTRTRRDFLAVSGTALLLAGLGMPALARGASPTRSIRGTAFETTWQATLPDAAPADKLGVPIASLLAAIDRKMSPWRADSELSRFNQGPAGSVAVSAETGLVATVGLDIARASQGAFDPSVGPLVRRWGFGPITGSGIGSWQGLSARETELGKSDDGLTLDLCGIAKGRALDRMAELLTAAGHGDFLIDLGGELLARGRHPDGRPWQVGIEDPRPSAAGLSARLALKNRAIATSGLRANGYEFSGQRYSHIIDPRTREPVAGDLLSVSVVASDAMTADGWATALLAAGDAGPGLAAERGLAAMFQFRDGRGLLRATTGRFESDLL